MSSNPPPYFAIWFPIVFVIGWCCLGYLMSFLSGWQRLGARFRSDSHFDGFLKRNTSARMGWVNFSGCLNIGANSEGLHLSMMIIFRIGTPQLFVPWREIRVGETAGFWIFKTSQLRLGTEKKVRLSIRSSVMEELKAAAGPNWPARYQPPSIEPVVR